MIASIAMLAATFPQLRCKKSFTRISEKIVKDNGCALFCLQWQEVCGILNLHICMQIREVR